MKNPKTVKFFLDTKELKFENDSKLIGWVKRNLKLKTMLRVGMNYIPDSKELEKAFEDYLERQTQIYKEKVERVKTLREKKAIKNKKE
jgi:hypothetical protein